MPYSLQYYQYGYSNPVSNRDASREKVDCKAVYVTNPFTGAILGGTYACLGAHVVNLSSSPIRISGAFINGACSSQEVIEEMRAHPDGHFHGTRCVVDGTTNTEATGDFHILYPHESSDEYGYFDGDGVSALRSEDLPGVARRSYFYDRGTFYDSSWRYHPVNIEKTLVFDGHDMVESGGICREHLAIFQTVYRDAADLRSQLDPTNETKWPWNRWALPGERLNLRYPKHPL